LGKAEEEEVVFFLSLCVDSTKERPCCRPSLVIAAEAVDRQIDILILSVPSGK
jgi:hypothetical protein